MTLNKLFAVIACGSGLVLTCPCESAHAANSNDGTGHISCQATFSFQFDQFAESNNVSYEFNITKAEKSNDFMLTGVFRDLDDDEVMSFGPDVVKIRKKGSKFTARSTTMLQQTECDDDELDADGECQAYEISTRFKYRKNGGDAEFRIRGKDGNWIDVLNFHEEFDGGFAAGKGQCTFTTADDWGNTA